jgi:hypothetical protein
MEPHVFVRRTLAAFERARRAAPTAPECSYRLAGMPVRVRYAGERLAARFEPPLRPFAESGDTPALTISCWERNGSDHSPPPPPWDDRDKLPRGRIRGYDGTGVRATYDAERALLQLYDPELGHAACVARDAELVPPWVARAPFRSILGWWATDRGLAVVHASAVGDEDGCVLISGPSGSGKSTTALACAASGMGIISDDVALVELSSEPVAFATTGMAKVEDGSPVTLDSLGATVVEHRCGQTMVELRDRLVRCAPVRAVVAVRVGDAARSRVDRLGRGACFRALAGHSVVEALSGEPRSLARLRELADRVPGYAVALGRDLDDVAATVRTVLEVSR